MITFVTIMGVAIVLDVAHQIAFGQPWMVVYPVAVKTLGV